MLPLTFQKKEKEELRSEISLFVLLVDLFLLSLLCSRARWRGTSTMVPKEKNL